ncbi:MAG TPA: M56 family metallopeptidase, partial [Gemmatimonadaceae bacterium]|nr:M56 family metallopeptidase [Gemmatimonadaceae bacterium]
MFEAVTLDVVLWTTLKGSVIAALAFAATQLLRRRPAAVRHAIWMVAVVAQLLLPVSGSLLPRRALAVSVPLQITAPLAIPTKAIAETPAVPLPQETASRTWRLPDLRLLLAIGTALFLLRIAFGTLRVHLIARRSERVLDGEWLSLVQHHCQSLGITRPVTLLRSERIQLPVTWGFIYPTILLPAAARSWTAELRRHVLLHELAHVRRADALTQLAGQLALAMFWFNPMTWLAVARMRGEAENACDDYVLRDGERPSVYATTLVELVRAHTGPSLPAFASLGIGRRSELETRVDAITRPGRDASSRRALLAFAVIASVLLMVPLSAMQRAAAAMNDDESPKKRTVVVSGKGRAAGIECASLVHTGFNFVETSGTLTNDGVTVHYFFLRPTSDRCLESSISMNARFTEDDRDFVAEPG